MVVMPSVTVDKVNVNAANMPWEAETVEPTDTSSSSSEDAFGLLEATREQSGKEVARTQSGRWSDLLDSAGMAQSPELCEGEEEPTGEEEEDDFAEELDEPGESSGKTKRRTRRRRRNKKAASDASTASGGLRTPCSGLSTPSDMVESAEFFSTYPHTPSKYVGFSTPCHSSPAARNGRSVVTCFDILGQELSLSPKTGAMHASGMATAPRVAATVPTCTFKPIAEASTPTSRQDSYVEAGARSAAWYPQSPMAMNHWGSSPLAQAPMALSPMDNRQACLSMLGFNHNACTQDLAEQLRAVAPETYED